MKVFEVFILKMEALGTAAVEQAVEEGKTDAEVDAEMQTIMDYKQKLKRLAKESMAF